MTSGSTPLSTSSTHDEGELGLLTVHVNHIRIGNIVSEDGSGRKFELYLTHPSLLSEPYVVAAEQPGEYRVFVPETIAGELDIKLMERDPVTPLCQDGTGRE